MGQKSSGSGGEGAVRWVNASEPLHWEHELPTMIEKYEEMYEPIGHPEGTGPVMVAAPEVQPVKGRPGQRPAVKAIEQGRIQFPGSVFPAEGQRKRLLGKI